MQLAGASHLRNVGWGAGGVVAAADARSVRQTQTTSEDALSPFRIGMLLGALSMAVYLLWGSTSLPYDVLTWSFFAFVVACGGLFVGGVVHAWQKAREAPETIIRSAGVLVLLSFLALGPHFREVRKAAVFMQTADSARGLITREYIRGGLRLTVSFQVNSERHTVRRKARWQERDLRTGDSVWIYFQPEAPPEALVGRPGPDPFVTLHWLAIIWVVGGVLILGYLGPLLMKRVPAPQSGQVAVGGGAA
jgi:hypothetical protein